MQIWKYQLGNYPGRVDISVPKGGVVRSVGLQDALCQVWIEVDPQAPVEPRHFEIMGTGQEIPRIHAYCGTVLAPPFVWHIYETVGHR